MTGRVAHGWPSDFQPTLVGPSITVRSISKDDWAEMFAAGSDPEIWKVHPVPDRYTEAGFRKFFDGAVDSKMGFAFVDQASGRLIGSSRNRDNSTDSRLLSAVGCIPVENVIGRVGMIIFSTPAATARRLPSATGGSARWCNSVTLVAALQRQPRNAGRGSRRGCAAY